jgi:hypothetical protein
MELYEQFAPVRRSLKGRTEAEINRAIEGAPSTALALTMVPWFRLARF